MKKNEKKKEKKKKGKKSLCLGAFTLVQIKNLLAVKITKGEKKKKNKDGGSLEALYRVFRLHTTSSLNGLVS